MRQRLAVLVLTAVGWTLAEPAFAIPAFARRYKVECHFCHDIYPKLNSMGQRFKERGFRMEREDAFDASKWLRSVPVAGRAEGNHTFLEGADDVNFGFLKGISAGNLGARVSYWVDDGVVVNEKQRSADKRFTHVKPDNAWLRFEVVPGGKLYAKAGRIELDLPFTQTRTPHLFSYDVYLANTGFETDAIGSFQDGVEIGGDLPRDTHWSAAVVKGHNSDEARTFSKDAGKFDGNLFLRLSKRLGRHRVGAFTYIGRNTLALAPNAAWDDHLLRVGADAAVWISRLNLYGVYAYGRNDNSIADPAHPSGTKEPLDFSGGFAQADYHVRDDLALTLRLNAVNRPPGATNAPNKTFSGLFPGVQAWVLDGYVKLSFEYGFLNQDQKSLGAVQADVAF